MVCYLPKPPLNHFVNKHCRFGVIYLQYIYIIFLCLHWDAPKMYHDSSISIQLHIIYSIVMSIGWMELQHLSSHVNIRGHPNEFSGRKNFWRFGVSLFGEIQCPMYPYVLKTFFWQSTSFSGWLVTTFMFEKKKKQILRHQDVRLISAFLKRYFNEGVRRSNESSLDGGWSPWLKHGIWMNLVAILW